MLEDIHNRILDFQKLQKGWLNGQGEEITQAAVDTAQTVLRGLTGPVENTTVFPTVMGGILFEFCLIRDMQIDAIWAIEVFPDGLIKFDGIDSHSSFANEHGIIEPIRFDSPNDEFFKIINQQILM